MNNHHPSVHSWRRWLFSALPPLAAVLFALALTLPALAATVFTITSPINETVLTCNGEEVAFSGNEHETLHVTFDRNGGFHSDVHANFQDVTGVGDQDHTYHVPQAFHATLIGKVGRVNTLTQTFDFISTGAAANFVLKEDAHITINANGTITSSHDHFRTACQG